MTPHPLDDTVDLVRRGLSLRRALALTGLPQTSRMALTRRLKALGISYRWAGKGQHDDSIRLFVLQLVGNPCSGGPKGYWTEFAAVVSELEKRTVTAETIQLWYGRRFGPAYVTKGKSI